MASKLSTLIIILGLGGLVTGCENKPKSTEPLPIPMEVLVVPASLELGAGSSEQLRGQVNDSERQPIGGASIEFKSSDSNIVSVSALGLLSAPGRAGEAIISVSSGIRATQVRVRVVAAKAAIVEAVQGPAAESIAGTAIGDIRVRVRDEFNNPVAAATLHWRAMEPGSSLESPDDSTGIDGTGTARWIAGEQIGTRSLEVTSGSLAPLILRTMVGPGPATTLNITTDPTFKTGDSVTAGTTVHVSAIVLDKFGNPIGSAKVSFGSIGDCGFGPAETQTDGAGITAPIDWVTKSSGRCSLMASLSNTALEAKLPLTVKDDHPKKKRAGG